MKVIMFTIVVVSFFATAYSVFAQDELFKAAHGGQELRRSGLCYEVVRTPKEILVYPPKEEVQTPDAITLEFKDKNGKVKKVQLKLTPIKEPGMNLYSAPIPANIYFSGGVTFDFP